jgi:hypothetical protein
LTAAWLSPAAAADPVLRSSFPIGSGIWKFLSPMDFDGDALTDLTVHDLMTQDVSLYRNAGSLSFQLSATITAGLSPYDVRSADLDEDGAADIVVGNLGSNSVTIAWGGSGFSETLELPLGISCRSLLLVDITGDHVLDIVSTGDKRGQVVIVAGKPGKSFAEPRVIPTSLGGPHALVCSDLSLDGRLDLAVWGRNTAPPYVVVLEGRDGGEFEEVPLLETFLAPGDVYQNAFARDFDADGNDELLIFVYKKFGQPGSGEAVLIEHAGQGGYDVKQLGRVKGFGCDVADMDGDGRFDLVVTGPDVLSGSATVVLGISGGTFDFERPCTVQVSSNPGMPVVRDFDRDGLPDIAIPARGESRVDLVLRPLTQCAASEAPCHETLVSFDLPFAGPVAMAEIVPGPPAEAVVVGETEVKVLALEGGVLREHAAFPVSGLPGQLGLGDLDGDGLTDVVLGDISRSRLLVYLLGPDGRPREEPAALQPGIISTHLTVADLNRDGKADILASSSAQDSLSIFLAGETGGFDPPIRQTVTSSPAGIAVSDLDADGVEDIAVALEGSSEILVLTGSGGGEWPDSFKLSNVSTPEELLAADVDGDATKDLVALGASGGTVDVLLNLPDGFESRPYTLPSRVTGRVLETGDLNGDGLPEVLVSDPILRVIIVLENLGGGELRQSGGVVELPPAQSTGGAIALAVEDMDRDGLQDIVLSDSGTGTVAVYRSLGCRKAESFRRGDVDQDGGVRITDAIGILLHLFAGAGPLACADAADIGDDGTVNLTDAVALLLYLFQGGARPASPGPLACGPDGAVDSLGRCMGPPCR